MSGDRSSLETDVATDIGHGWNTKRGRIRQTRVKILGPEEPRKGMADMR